MNKMHSLPDNTAYSPKGLTKANSFQHEMNRESDAFNAARGQDVILKL